MKAAVIVFPGSNCDRDLKVALTCVGADVADVWYQDTTLPAGLDIVAIPGGFSYGDYLRSGAMAAVSPVMQAVKQAADQGRYILGICNGFQVLTESHLLPGALLRNQSTRFICEETPLVVPDTNTPFTKHLSKHVTFPVAHMDGAYFADEDTLDMLEAEERVAFRYRQNPNGSQRDIAGIFSANKRILGLMPHPERAFDAVHGNTKGRAFFQSIVDAI